jgi:hypothetical protein
MTETKENSGVLFEETSKKNPAAPDWTGHIVVGGAKVRVAGWVKKGAKGAFLSLKLTPPAGGAA